MRPAGARRLTAAGLADGAAVILRIKPQYREKCLSAPRTPLKAPVSGECVLLGYYGRTRAYSGMVYPVLTDDGIGLAAG